MYEHFFFDDYIFANVMVIAIVHDCASGRSFVLKIICCITLIFLDILLL